jgi:hypothetical protein
MARALVAESTTNNANELRVRRPVKYELNRRRLVGRAAQRREKMIAFGYYGGKFSHLDFILPLLPTTYRHYCEPFGGSAAVLINRKPSEVETLRIGRAQPRLKGDSSIYKGTGIGSRNIR